MKRATKKHKKYKRLKARVFSDIPYVHFTSIQKFHGKEWADKWAKAFGVGTGLYIPPKERGKNKLEEYAIYYWDYERFADRVDKSKETYFD